MENKDSASYESVKERLDEIVEAVSDEGISLDDALDLYEEAVKLGLQVSNLLEEDIAESQIAAVFEEHAEVLADTFEGPASVGTPTEMSEAGTPVDTDAPTDAPGEGPGDGAADEPGDGPGDGPAAAPAESRDGHQAPS
ncbi:MAG: exodeoxyribonuclease VII small subunit [Eggerthellaceae bacterium]|jgi:exodeoxyribonuclease VII small subunit|nr:exodeoxyribonuclease VII small subunit [Eggerthellaceae bacterium]MDR2716240.1 exodeoxyribonuclease VII small subunit [Coriobacteriaceae bacterium]